MKAAIEFDHLSSNTTGLLTAQIDDHRNMGTCTRQMTCYWDRDPLSHPALLELD